MSSLDTMRQQREATDQRFEQAEEAAWMIARVDPEHEGKHPLRAFPSTIPGWGTCRGCGDLAGLCPYCSCCIDDCSCRIGLYGQEAQQDATEQPT